MSRELTLADISDLREYERGRDEFLATVIALKARRRIAVGPYVTVMFENRTTVRFQIQEMARAEKILSDGGIETELRVYNPLIPEPGELRATLFIELTSEELLREWLPKLVGIETAVVLRLADGTEVRSAPDPDHAAQLTRESVTPSVHYIGWTLGQAAVEAFALAPPLLVVDHDSYRHETRLSAENQAELLEDLRP